VSLRRGVGTTEGEGWHGGGAPTTAESGVEQGAGPSLVTLALLRASPSPRRLCSAGVGGRGLEWSEDGGARTRQRWWLVAGPPLERWCADPAPGGAAGQRRWLLLLEHRWRSRAAASTAEQEGRRAGRGGAPVDGAGRRLPAQQLDTCEVVGAARGGPSPPAGRPPSRQICRELEASFSQGLSQSPPQAVSLYFSPPGTGYMCTCGWSYNSKSRGKRKKYNPSL
jgi:hypothetical protein